MIGMKSAGDMVPRLGEIHRSRASAPTMRPVASSTTGW